MYFEDTFSSPLCGIMNSPNLASSEIETNVSEIANKPDAFSL
jgi:hypothetical protein